MTLKMLAAGTAAAFAAVALFGVTAADAQTQRKKNNQRPVLVRSVGPNVSYQRGPTRIYVTKRSWLDAGTEVLPGERKYQDYAFPPGYSASGSAVPRSTVRGPLSDTPWDLGGYPTAIPLY
ncbi:MAG: hypothetical protein ACOY4O_02905 [Pseudomonadota bacterium]|jgi:hypothetical protein